MTKEWDAKEHIGTSPSYGRHYLNSWPACKLIKGFRIRPKFQKWLNEHGSDRDKLASMIDFRATLGLR